jgi:hypothetical protein
MMAHHCFAGAATELVLPPMCRPSPSPVAAHGPEQGLKRKRTAMTTLDHRSAGLAHHSRGRNAAILSLCDDREAPKQICRKIMRGHGAAETASCLADEALPQLLRNKFCGMFAAAKR